MKEMRSLFSFAWLEQRGREHNSQVVSTHFGFLKFVVNQKRKEDYQTKNEKKKNRKSKRKKGGTILGTSSFAAMSRRSFKRANNTSRCGTDKLFSRSFRLIFAPGLSTT
jgi:hypothetical protein